MSFTESDFNSWRFNRGAVHFNGGKVFFGYGHRCVDQPRLLVIDKYFKADRSTKRSYMVDGKTQCETLPEALAALDAPPSLDDVQRRLLADAPADFARVEGRVAYVELAEMGFIEWGRDAENRVTLRRSAAGTAHLEGVRDA